MLFASSLLGQAINQDGPLFEVKNEQNQTVFAVYPGGVKIFIDEQLKATGGGFTVGRLGTGKSTSEDFFSVAPGDVRVNIYDDPQTLKGTGGGFTVGRLGTGKTTDVEFLSVKPDFTQISYNPLGATTADVGFAINKLGYAGSEQLFGLNDDNTYLGHNSGKSVTTGLYNAFLGYESGSSTTIGEKNTFVGYLSGKSNILGNSNVFIGENAGFSNEAGHFNTFLGTYSGYSNKDSSFCTYVGYKAGQFSMEGYNTYVGYESGTNGVDGTNRAFYGYGAGNNNSGDENTFLGTQAGFNSGTGARNVYVGSGAGKSAIGTGNILLGYNAGSTFAGDSALIVAFDSIPLIYGEFNNKILEFSAKVGIGRTPTANQLEVEGTASNTTASGWVTNSDKRIKTDITDISNASNIIMSLRPVKYKYTDEWKKRNPSIKDQFYYSYIAQEFQKVFPESVKGSGQYLENDKNEILQIDIHNAEIVSIKAIQELITENNKQQAEIESLKAMVNQLSAEKQMLTDNQQSIEAKIDGMNDQIDQLKTMILQSGK